MAQPAAHPGKARAHVGEAPVAVPVSGTALLLIDVINDLAFPCSESLVAQAEAMAGPLAGLKRRAMAAGVPTVYINDNFGQWRSDFRRTVAHCTARSSPGRRVSRRLRPTARDYFVLKPKHSGFFDTTLDTLLETLRIRRVILTGMAGNICVLFTANDAYMREYKIFAPADCIVSNTAADNDHALRQIKTVLKGTVVVSTRLSFRSTRRTATAEAPMTARRNAARVSKVMRQVFGLAELRPGQQAVIDAVLARRHTLAIMPTGAGKSLCYQVPAMLMPGMTVVVSPLIALMRDQFEKLSELGLEAVQVNSAIPTGDIRRARARIGRRTVEFVFTTPEQLAATDLRQLLSW